MDILFKCSQCSGDVEIQPDGDATQCDTCGRRYKLAGHLCPNCLTYYDSESAVCLQCGEATSRLCSRCQTNNWAGDEFCRECGASLDIVEQMPGRTAEGYRDRLRHQMLSADRLKQVEAEASSARMAKLMAVEEQRQIELNRRLKKRKEEERKLLIYSVGGAILVLVFFIMLIIFT